MHRSSFRVRRSGVQLAPQSSFRVRLTFDISPGEYQILFGYGGGVHETASLASNEISFIVGPSGATVIGSAVQVSENPHVVSDDQTVKVWDANGGQELLALPGHRGGVTSVAWSPDGKHLASAGSDGIVQIYAMDIHDLLKLARSRVTRDLTADECLRYFQSKTCPPLPQ